MVAPLLEMVKTALYLFAEVELQLAYVLVSCVDNDRGRWPWSMGMRDSRLRCASAIVEEVQDLRILNTHATSTSLYYSFIWINITAKHK